MRISPLVSALVIASLAGFGCGGDKPEAKSPESSSSSSSGGSSSGTTEPASSTDGVAVGKPAPKFSLETVNAKGKAEVKEGKVTIVDFWATWCEPCKKSFPKYQDLYTKYNASGVEIVAISVDDEKTKIPDFIKAHGAKFPVAWDDGHKVADQWKPENMPSAYVVDKKGVIRHVHKGYHDGEEAEIEKEIKELLK